MPYSKNMIKIPLRHKFLLRQLIRAQNLYFPQQEIQLLDVGAGNGAFILLATQGMKNIKRIDGVDIDSESANFISPRGAIYLQDLQLGTGKIPLGAYHIVTLWETIEHVENIYAFFRHLKKLLVPGGMIAMATPNLFSLSRIIKGQHWIGVRDTTHKILYDQLNLKRVLDHCGFSLVKICHYYFPNRLPRAWYWVNSLLSRLPGGGMLFALAKALP